MPNEWWKSPELASIFKGGAGASPQQAPEMPAQTIPTKGGFTGAGPDGVVQPDRRVPGPENYDKHESEFVMKADATQAIGPDVLNAMMESAVEGKLDLNKIREGIGMDPKMGYQAGGETIPVPRNGGRTGTAAPTRKPTSPTPNPPWKKPKPFGIGSKGNKNPNIVGPDQQNIDPINPDTINPDIVGPDEQTIPNLNLDQNIVNPDIIGPLDINKPPDLVADITGPGQKNLDDLGFIKKDSQGITPDKIKPLPKPPPDLTEGEKQNWIPKPPDPDTVPTDEEITSDDIMDYLNGIMDGSHPYFQTIKDLVSQDLGGAGAATTAALKQQGAMAGMSADQIASMGMTRARDIESTTSEAMGKLAAGQMEMGMQAAKDLWGMNMEQQQFDFAKEKYGDQEGMLIAQMIGAGASYDMIKAKFPNITLDDYNSMKNFSNMGWQQEMFKEQMDWAKEKWGDEQGMQIGNLVNQGWSLEQIQKQFPDLNITQADYDSMKEMSPMGFQKGQWEYNKKVDAFNQLLAQGGAENFGAAADLYNEMFGTDIDFSNALTEENIGKFNDTYNEMMSDIASGKSFEDWKKTADANGTFDDLNMTATDIKSMYQNMQLQSNPVWQASEQLKLMMDKGLLDEDEYEDMMAIMMEGIKGGITVSDAYQVLDKNGDEVGNFKTQQEADDFIAENPDAGYTSNVLENSWFDFGDGSGTGPDPDPDPSGGTSGDPLNPYKDSEWNDLGEDGQNEHFMGSVPIGIAEEWEGEDGYNKWVEAGRPQTYDGYLDALEQGVGDFTKTLQDKYKDNWAVPDYSDYLNPDSKRLAEEGIKKGREKFLAGGEGLYSFGKTELEDLKHSGIYDDPRFTTPGSVFSFKGINPMAVAYLSPPDGIVFYDLVTGKEVRMGKAPSGAGVTFS